MREKDEERRGTRVGLHQLLHSIVFHTLMILQLKGRISIEGNIQRWDVSR